MLVSLTKTTAAAAFAVGLALAGLVVSPADAVMRTGGGHGGGSHGGGFHGGGGGYAGGAYGGGGYGGGGYGGYGGGYGGYGYGYGAAALGLGLLGGAIIGSQYPYSDSGYGYGAEYDVDPQNAGGDSPTYCASRFRSYDPASGTYLGYDGLRHPCP
jgi:hypothetical protein